MQGMVCFHPSIRLEGMAGGDPMELAQCLDVPLFMATAGNDPDNVKPGGELEKITEEKGIEGCVFLDYPERKHGWTLRGDVSEAGVARDTDDVCGRAQKWLEDLL